VNEDDRVVVLAVPAAGALQVRNLLTSDFHAQLIHSLPLGFAGPSFRAAAQAQPLCLPG
jgi:hypothetical protein